MIFPFSVYTAAEINTFHSGKPKLHATGINSIPDWMPKQEQSMRLTTHIRKLKQTRNTLRNMQSQSGQNRIQKILVLFYLIFHKINRFRTKPHMSTSKSTH